jgi:hypothetical protein
MCPARKRIDSKVEIWGNLEERGYYRAIIDYMIFAALSLPRNGVFGKRLE